MNNEHVTVTQADYDLAEAVTSAANIVTCDGYYEVDLDMAATTIARHRIEATANVEPDTQALLQEARAALVKIRDGDDNWQITATEALTKLDAALGVREHG